MPSRGEVSRANANRMRAQRGEAPQGSATLAGNAIAPVEVPGDDNPLADNQNQRFSHLQRDANGLYNPALMEEMATSGKDMRKYRDVPDSMRQYAGLAQQHIADIDYINGTYQSPITAQDSTAFTQAGADVLRRQVDYQRVGGPDGYAARNADNFVQGANLANTDALAQLRGAALGQAPSAAAAQLQLGQENAFRQQLAAANSGAGGAADRLMAMRNAQSMGAQQQQQVNQQAAALRANEMAQARAAYAGATGQQQGLMFDNAQAVQGLQMDAAQANQSAYAQGAGQRLDVAGLLFDQGLARGQQVDQVASDQAAQIANRELGLLNYLQAAKTNHDNRESAESARNYQMAGTVVTGLGGVAASAAGG